jgi:hypothetical protein
MREQYPFHWECLMERTTQISIGKSMPVEQYERVVAPQEIHHGLVDVITQIFLIFEVKNKA